MQPNVFKSKMALFGETFETLSTELKIHRSTLINKANGKADFKQSEIDFFIDRWHLTAAEVVQIFFDGA